MRIAIFSWRDIKHPYGGGAELLSHEMAKRWVVMGNEVIHFSALFPGGKKKELIDGITYIRRGNWYNVHLYAFWFIIARKFNGLDVIVDEVHGIPFFANIYSRTAVVCLACEVAQEIWDQMYSFPLNRIGKLFERIYLKLYKNVPFLTISNSTKKDLVSYGVQDSRITVVPMGFSYKLPSILPKKTTEPLVIFLGRLTPAKGISDAISAFSQIHKQIPKAKMFVVGRGTEEYEQKLKKKVDTLHLNSAVFFKGFVSEKEKFKYLAQAHIILVPSIREGWGLIVPEANIVGTPAIVYNVPGLSDVVKNNVNGIIIKKNTPQLLAEESLKLLTNKERYLKLSKTAKKRAQSMSWDDTARIALRILQQSNTKK